VSLANLLVIALFAVILMLVTGGTFWNSLANTFILTMSSDGIYDFQQNKDVLELTIKIIFIIIEMLMFSGLMIGFITNFLQTVFESQTEIKGKLHLRNHFVFLNWSALGPDLIYDLSFYDKKPTIVILADVSREEVINSIDNVFIERSKKRRRKVRVFVKEGNPLSSKYLSDVSIEKACGIAILIPSDSEGSSSFDFGVTSKDLATFKLLMSIGKLEQPNCNIVVEVETQSTVEKIEKLIQNTSALKDAKITVFSHNMVLGNLIGRITTNSDFNPLFLDLLSFEGVEFYALKDVQSIDDALRQYDDCLPVCTYDDDRKVDEKGNLAPDQLYVLSYDNTHFGKRAKERTFDRRIPYKENFLTESFTLYIVGSFTKAEFIMKEIEASNSHKLTHNVCKHFSFDEAKNLLGIVNLLKKEKDHKKLLLLSDEDVEINQIDANIYVSLLSLKSAGIIDGNDIEILTEIINPSNQQSVVNFGVDGVVISNKMISLYLIQLLTHSDSKRFYRDIISTDSDENDGDIDLDITLAKELLDIKSPLSFSSKAELVNAFYYSSNKKRMIIAYKKDNSVIFLADKMDAEEEIVIDPNTVIYTIAY